MQGQPGQRLNLDALAVAVQPGQAEAADLLDRLVLRPGSAGPGRQRTDTRLCAHRAAARSRPAPGRTRRTARRPASPPGWPWPARQRQPRRGGDAPWRWRDGRAASAARSSSRTRISYHDRPVASCRAAICSSASGSRPSAWVSSSACAPLSWRSRCRRNWMASAGRDLRHLQGDARTLVGPPRVATGDDHMPADVRHQPPDLVLGLVEHQHVRHLLPLQPGQHAGAVCSALAGSATRNRSASLTSEARARSARSAGTHQITGYWSRTGARIHGRAGSSRSRPPRAAPAVEWEWS